MKKRFLLALALVFLLFACGQEAQVPAEEGWLVYYLAPADEAQGSDRLRSSLERLELPEDASLQEAGTAVVERLLAGPADGKLLSPIPAGVSLLSLEVRDRRAYVDLSGSFSQLGGVELALADYCLTLSLTALDGISAVSITANGRAVVQQPKRVFYERDVLLSTMDDVLQTVEVTLYFLDSEGALVGEARTLDVYEGQTLAENLIAALLEGPQNRELTQVIPEDLQINFVRVEGGVCYLNLSAASLEALPEDQDLQQKILWSLAHSLYSLEAVEELRLLADGEELDRFGSVSLESIAVRPQG